MYLVIKILVLYK